MNVSDDKSADLSTARRAYANQTTFTETLRATSGKMCCLPPNTQRNGEGGLRLNGHVKSASNTIIGKSSAPVITVITAAYNAAKTLEKTILSVVGQGYPNVELIIVDGGSTDGTLEILRKFEHVIDYWVSEPDNGIFDAWNKGVSLSSGEWIAFLGADDVYLDGALDAYAAVILKNHGVTLDYISSRVNLTKGDKIVRVIGGRWNFRAFSKYMNVAHVGSLHHARLFEQGGGFNPTYRICGDYEFLLRPRGGLLTDYFDTVTVNMSIGGVSDANWRALLELTKAKIHTGGRNSVLSYIEFGIAIVKWKVRRWIWY